MIKRVLGPEVATSSCLAYCNGHPRPFLRIAKPVGILDKIKRGKQSFKSER